MYRKTESVVRLNPRISRDKDQYKAKVTKLVEQNSDHM